MSANAPTSAPATLFDKIWQLHAVTEENGQTLLYIDRHYVSDDLPPSAYRSLAQRDLQIRRPQNTVGMPDHYVASRGGRLIDVVDAERREMIEELRARAQQYGFLHFGVGDSRQGIIHVTGPEQGLSLPGMTVVCGDSHTSTHGALGALGFGIGASEVTHVLATQALWQVKPETMQVAFTGSLGAGVTAKDMALGFIRQVGVAGAAQHVIEYTGEAVRNLSIESRMTLCNMSIEAGARAGMVAPDTTTLAYLKGRPYAPTGEEWARRSAQWLALASDCGAQFARKTVVPLDGLSPMVSWGTDPAQSCGIHEAVPTLDEFDQQQRIAYQRALEYIGLTPGQPLAGTPVDRVFIGSCTNGRIEDLRMAASIAKGRKAKVRALVVPGSGLVKAQAEAEGLDRIFAEAGFEWGAPGCSMCLAVNGDQGRPGERCVSTTNRNFVGRQGPGVRTHLASPLSAAAAAIHGRLVDPREMLHASI